MEPLGSCRLTKTRFLSVFWLFLCVQSNTFLVFKRTCPVFNTNAAYYCGNAVGGLIGKLANAMIRLSQLVSDTTIHITLIYTIGDTITSFLKMLEQLDEELKRPKLMCVKKASLVGFVYLTTTVRMISDP